jgi:hypothetical protein
MDNQVPMSQPPLTQPPAQQEPQLQDVPLPTMPDVEAMKAQARELAIQQFLATRAAMPPQPIQPTQVVQQSIEPKVIYVRRNLTVAELIVVFAIACGLVIGVPNLWKFTTDRLPQIEIKMK